jgi:cytochrome c553
MTKPTALAIALLAATALLSAGMLSACSPSGETPAEHSSADRSEGHTSSSSGLPAGDAAAGARLAETKNAKTGQACVDCHGAGGNAPIDPTYPKLGGQYHDYIAQALQKYRDGDRKQSLMASQAADLSDQQIADLAAYFGSQPTQLRDLSHL